MHNQSASLNRLILYVPLATCIWGLVAWLIAPAQWMVLGPSVACGTTLGVLTSTLLSVWPSS